MRPLVWGDFGECQVVLNIKGGAERVDLVRARGRVLSQAKIGQVSLRQDQFACTRDP